MSKRTALDTMHYERSEFERSLLASAGSDGPTAADAEHAWLTFEADARALATLIPAVCARDGAMPRTTPSAPRPRSATVRAQALKWLLIGAVGGGSLVALWHSRGSSPLPPPLPVAVSWVARAPEPLAPSETPIGAEQAPVTAASIARAEAAALTQGGATRPVPASPSARRTVLPSVRGGMTSESRLAREVAALDAARAALAIGANARVLLRLRPRDPHVAHIAELEAAAREGPAARSR